MTRFILLALALSAINPITDILVDRAFKQAHQSTAYSQSETDAMKRLWSRKLDKPAKPKHTMSEGEQAATWRYLGMEVLGK